MQDDHKLDLASAATGLPAAQALDGQRIRPRLPKGMLPQDVPIIAIDDGLPMIPTAQQSIAALRQRFEERPIWTPERLGENDGRLLLPVQAAVLIPIVIRPEPTVVLTRRSAQLRSHSGQVAFPGGKLDPSDASPVAAALREAAEEVAIPATSVEVLGQFPAYVTASGFEITPVVGLIPAGMVFQPNPSEVDEVFEVPLSFLLNPANHRHHVFRSGQDERRWLSMPYAVAGKEHYIWGVTASIIRNLYRFLQTPSSL